MVSRSESEEKKFLEQNAAKIKSAAVPILVLPKKRNSHTLIQVRRGIDELSIPSGNKLDPFIVCLQRRRCVNRLARR